MMRLAAIIRRNKLAVVDTLRYSAAVREVIGWLGLFRALMCFDPVARGEKLARALGFASSRTLARLCVAKIHSKPGIEGCSEIWSRIVRGLPRYRHLVKERPHLDRSIVLKAPGEDGEKGVLLMTFEYNWARLLLGLSDDEFKWMEERYTLVLSTSWSPTDYAVLALALCRTTETLFVQSCNYGEIEAIERFHPRLKCLATLPCDWINPELYSPKPPDQRTTDIVMVANWGEFKRHWELFRALSAMPPSLNVVLIGQQEGGRTVEALRSLADDFGVPQQLQFIESAPIQEVARQQCNAKVSVIMSLREGCCVAAVESLFAGCALALREDAHVGPLAYINEQTGRRLKARHLAEELLALISEAGGLNPRGWAMENLAGEISRQKLNDLLFVEAGERGHPWTRDIVLPQWRPHPTFANDEDREAMRPAYADLHERFPHVFSAVLISDSWR